MKNTEALESAAVRTIGVLKKVIADLEASKAREAELIKKIDEVTALLNGEVPEDVGGSTGGVIG